MSDSGQVPKRRLSRQILYEMWHWVYMCVVDPKFINMLLYYCHLSSTFMIWNVTFSLDIFILINFSITIIIIIIIIICLLASENLICWVNGGWHWWSVTERQGSKGANNPRAEILVGLPWCEVHQTQNKICHCGKVSIITNISKSTKFSSNKYMTIRLT